MERVSGKFRRYSGEDDYERMRRLVGGACGRCDSTAGTPPYVTLGDLDWWRCTGDSSELAGCEVWDGAASEIDAFLWPSEGQVDIATRTGDAELYERVLMRWEEIESGGRGLGPGGSTRVCWAFSGDGARNEVLSRRGYTRGDRWFSLCACALEGAELERPRVGGAVIRCARGPAEAAAIAGVHRAAFNSGRLSASHYERVMSAATYRPDLHLVGEVDGAAAGFTIAWLDAVNGVGVIEPLAVDPRWRGMGLGGALLGAALGGLRAAGARVALVNVAAKNAGAGRVYAGCGFREWDRNWAWSREGT